MRLLSTATEDGSFLSVEKDGRSGMHYPVYVELTNPETDGRVSVWLTIEETNELIEALKQAVEE